MKVRHVSKREFCWALSKLIPEMLNATLKGLPFNVPDLVKSFGAVYLARKLHIPENDRWIIDVAVDTVSVVAHELSTSACFTFAEKDSFCWEILTTKEQEEFTRVYGDLLK